MDLLVTYGSETGNAEETARTIWKDARIRNLRSKLLNFADYDIQKLPNECCVIFVLSTSGQGEMPTAFRKNWKLLCRRSLPSDSLKRLHFAVLGLGDSSYQKYNYAGKKLYRRLCQLGANALLDLALADDQHELGVQGAYGAFRDTLFAKIQNIQIFPDIDLDVDESKKLPPPFRLNFSGNIGANENVNKRSNRYTNAVVIDNKRLTSSDHFQKFSYKILFLDTRLVTIDASDEELRYSAGDVLMVYPHNNAESIRIAINALGYNDELLDRKFIATPTDDNIQPLPSFLFREGMTLRRCFERYFDLQMIPRQSFFHEMAKLSNNAFEKERLKELSQNIDDYMLYCCWPRRTTAETFRDFPQTVSKLEPESLFEIFCAIRPRPFSIASSPSAHLHLQILVAKVEYMSKRMATPRLGLCSTFICQLREGDEINVSVRPGTFRWPPPNCSLILVGPGTGVAPFRSILNERQRSTGQKVESYLFFGCRGAQKDYYFADEWPTMERVRVITAFSRDDLHKKVYVQDKVEEYGEEIWSMIKKTNGHIFIAGRAGDMPREITRKIELIAKSNGEDGKKLVELMEAKGQIQYETWS